MLIESTTFNGLDVCPDCGWTVIQVDKHDHPAQCRKVEGANAKKLASEKLARENAADIHRQYLHVTVELLEFALVNTIDVSKELRRDKR